MYKLKILKHSEISKNILEDIIRIKSIAWPYSYNKQIDWINKNLKDSDLHILLLEGEEPVAYLNLISIDFILDNYKYSGFGIGNVCTIEKKKGYGKLIIQLTAQYLSEKNKIGLLLCKPELVNFYKRYGWTVIKKSKLCLSFDNRDIEMMLINHKSTISKLTFSGQAF
ncbi:MAG: GNAT family N-acetyltransferase [Bacteroidetes bacterium]|nr:GNAT family N-acetyltransferase [Bacteroidota bacterium]